MTAWRPRTLLDWMILVGAGAFLLFAVSGAPTMLRECSKPIMEMPGWCLMIVGPAR